MNERPFPHLSRRVFLQTTALLGAGIGGLALTGCSPQEGPSKEEPLAQATTPAESEVVETIECDILVAGSGTAGTFAAVRAAEQGANVLWLEKLGVKGGTSAHTEGICVVGSSLMLNADVDLRMDELWHSYMEVQNWGVPSNVLKAYFENDALAIDWAIEHGAEVIYSPVSDDTYWGGVCITPEGAFKPIGEGILSHLWEYGDTMPNLEFRSDTPVEDLIVENDSVVGAFAKGANGYIKVTAKAVILATGGFANSDEYLDRYVNILPEEVLFYGLEGRDGDGVRMALSLGAHLHAPSALMYTSGSVKGSTSMPDIVNATFAWPSLLQVNQNGERFVNEGFCATNNTAARNIALRQQETSWAIADAPHVDAYIEMGVFDFFTGVTEGNLAQEIDSYDTIVKANSIEELASLMNVDAKALQESVDAYNGVANGSPDLKFGLKPDQVIPLLQPPFYAAQLCPSAYATEGGPLTNESMQVLRVDNTPIEGLYAIGNDNGSVLFTNYPMHVLGGTAQGWAAASGFAAAKHATDAL